MKKLNISYVNFKYINLKINIWEITTWDSILNFHISCAPLYIDLFLFQILIELKFKLEVINKYLK